MESTISIRVLRFWADKKPKHMLNILPNVQYYFAFLFSSSPI